MRMYMLGLFGFITAGLVGLQGLVVYTGGDKAGRAMAGTIALYQETPKQARRLIKAAVQECLEEEANGELPDYYTDVISSVMVKAIRFAGDRDYSSTDNPAVRAFVAEMSETSSEKMNQLVLRLKREPLAVRKRMLALVQQLESNPTAVARCMGPKVLRMSRDA